MCGADAQLGGNGPPCSRKACREGMAGSADATGDGVSGAGGEFSARRKSLSFNVGVGKNDSPTRNAQVTPPKQARGNGGVMGGRGPMQLARRLSSTAVVTLVDSSRLRWRKRMAKVLSVVFLVCLMTATLLSGHLYCILAVLCLECVCFREIISVSFLHSSVRRYVRSDTLVEEKELPFFKTINWFFFVCANFFAFGMPITRWVLTQYNAEGDELDAQLLNLKEHHQFVSFSLYTVGVMMFVNTLKYGYYKFQFAQFGWTHMLLLGIVSQAYVLACNIVEGFIWFVLPIAIVAALGSGVRVMGYLARRFTLPFRLVSSYAVAAVCTVCFAFWAAGIMASHPYFICPVQELSWGLLYGELSCKPSDLFIKQTYDVPALLQPLCAQLLEFWRAGETEPQSCATVQLYPVQLHAAILAAAATAVVPWATSMTQGFKKAFFLDEGVNTGVPSYGALSRRVDTQLLMATLTYVYYDAFILSGSKQSRASSFALLVDMCLRLSAQRREHLLQLLRQSLESDGVLQPTGAAGAA